MTIYSLDVPFFYLEPVGCSMSSSHCCFLTCIQISQEAGLYSLDVLLSPIWNQSVIPCPVLTVASWLAYRFLKRQVRCLVFSSLEEFSTVCFGPHLGVQNEAGQTPIEFCQENALVIANTFFQKQKRRLYTWTSPDGQHQNQIDYILWSQRWRSSIQSAKTRADCGSDHELLIAKFRLKLKKVGKTTRPFRYDLNHIPYDYTVEVRNRFKGLDLIECLMNYGWRFVTLYRRQGSRPSPWKRNAKKQNGCLGRPYK